jgi:hypothetical protein
VPRSGTTLLQTILCNSGNYFPMPETHFFSEAAHTMPAKNLTASQKERIFQVLAKKAKLDLDLTSLMRFDDKKEIFESIVDFYNKSDHTTFLEKTPRHIFSYFEIMQYYPDARFICMIREPRNAVASILDMQPSNKSVTRIALLYKKIFNHILVVSNCENVIVVRYEDLVGKPVKIVGNVCEFLGMRYDQNLLNNVAAPKEIVSPHEIWKNRNIDQKKIRKNRKARWKKRLSCKMGSLVMYINKSHVENFGYDIKYKRLKVIKGFLEDFNVNYSLKEAEKIYKIFRRY